MMKNSLSLFKFFSQHKKKLSFQNIEKYFYEEFFFSIIDMLGMWRSYSVEWRIDALKSNKKEKKR